MKNEIVSFYNEIRIPSVFSLLAVYCCYLSLTPLSEDFGWSVCVMMYIVTYIAAERIKTNFEHFKMTVDHIWKRVLAVVLFAYFGLSICGIAFLEKNGMDGFAFDRKWYIPITLVWLIPLFLEVFRLSKHIMTIPLKKPPKVPSWLIKILGVVLLMLNYGLWIYAFNPCISCYDTAFLYDQSHQMRIVPMVDWHPPFYAILQSWLIKIYDSVTFLVLLQCLLFSVAIVWIIDYLLKKGISITFAAFIYLFWGFSFNNVIQVVTLWKDVPYIVAILWLTFLLVRFVLDGDDLSVVWYIEFTFALIFTALIRQNGIVPSIVTSIVMMIYFIRKKKYQILIPVAVFLGAVVLVKGPIYTRYNIWSAPGLKYYALANDLVGTYYEISDPSEELTRVATQMAKNDLDGYSEQYNSYYLWVVEPEALGDYSIIDFLSIYAKTWFRHPDILTMNFMRRTSVLWSVVRPLEEMRCCVNNLDDYHLDPSPKYDYPHRIDNYFTNKLTYMSKGLTKNPLVYIFAWRTGIYALLLLFILFHLACDQNILALIPFVPIVFNVLSLYVGSGWTDYRYSWPTAVISVFLLAYTRVKSADHTVLTEVTG